MVRRPAATVNEIIIVLFPAVTLSDFLEDNKDSTCEWLTDRRARTFHHDTCDPGRNA